LADHDDRNPQFESHAPSAGAAVAVGDDGSWWATLGTLYVLNVMCEHPSAAPAAAMFPDLTPDRLHAVCQALAPDLAASLAACHVPGGSGHVPHTSIDLPDTSAHAAITPSGLAADLHHVVPVDLSAINVDVTVTVDVPSFTVDVPDFSVHVPHIDVSVSGFDAGHSHSF